MNTPSGPGTPTEAPRRVGLWRSVVLNLAFLVLATLLLNAFLVWNIGSDNRWSRRERQAVQTATLLAEQIEGTLLKRDLDLSPDQARVVEPLVEDLATGELAPYSLMVVDRSLEVVAEAGDPWTDTLPPADLREAVLEGRTFTGSERPRGSLWGPRTIYASIPVEIGARRIGGVRVSYLLGGSTTWLLDRNLLVFVLYCVGAIVIVVLFSTAIFRTRVLQPIRVLMVGTARVAEGMFSIRVPEEEPTEIGELAASFNQMAEELERYQARTEEQVAELQHINELLERTRDELALQARMAGVGRLAAGVAHEIGNPLSAVIGFVDLLRGGDLDPETREDLMRRVTDELGRAHTIVRDLLDYARPPEGDLEDVDVPAVVQASREMVAMQRDFDGIEIEAVVEGQIPPVRAESSRLRQVLINLLLNARDALEGKGQVTLRVRREGDLCTIAVRDSGPGVPPEYIDSIFDPFFTTKEPGSGTGLGLSVSLQIIEGFGGRLRYHPGEDGGAVFTVELPLAREG